MCWWLVLLKGSPDSTDAQTYQWCLTQVGLQPQNISVQSRHRGTDPSRNRIQKYGRVLSLAVAVFLQGKGLILIASAKDIGEQEEVRERGESERFDTEVPLHPLQDPLCVPTESGEHEEVDEGVHCRGGLGKQGDGNSVAVGDLLENISIFYRIFLIASDHQWRYFCTIRQSLLSSVWSVLLLDIKIYSY